VQSLKIDSKTSEITPELFEAVSGKDIKQSKLRVILVGPPKPPSPVPEGVEEDPSPVRVSPVTTFNDLYLYIADQEYLKGTSCGHRLSSNAFSSL
jgi:hypothetical protein